MTDSLCDRKVKGWTLCYIFRKLFFFAYDRAFIEEFAQETKCHATDTLTEIAVN